MIAHILICTLAIWGIHATTWPGMIFDRLHPWDGNPPWWSKPLYTCPICMASVWGSAYFFAFVYQGIEVPTILHYFPFILAVAGLSAIIVIAEPDDEHFK